MKGNISPKESKKNAAEFGEELDATGQENEEAAAKWVKELDKEGKQNRDRQTADILEVLHGKTKGRILDYWRSIAQLMTNMALYEDYPKEWYWSVAITDKGIVLYMEHDKHKYYRAIKPSFLPNYDLNAILKILESMWVLIEKKGTSGTIQVQKSLN